MADTTKELIDRHNRIAEETGQPTLTEWKRSKAELAERIEAMAEVTVTGPEPLPTVAELVTAMLRETELTYEGIAEAVRARLPCAATTARSVASAASRLRKSGADLPSRRQLARGVNSFVAKLLLETELTYSAIAERVRAEIEGARTTSKSVASTASRLRRDGVTVPPRSKGAGA